MVLERITKEEFDKRVEVTVGALRKEENTDFLEKMHKAHRMHWYHKLAFAIAGTYLFRARVYEATKRVLDERQNPV